MDVKWHADLDYRSGIVRSHHCYIFILFEEFHSDRHLCQQFIRVPSLMPASVLAS